MNTKKILLSLGALAAAGMGISFCSQKTEKSIHPEGDEQFLTATLINPPHDRCKILGKDLFTYLYLDTDGNRTTYEYVAADVRDITYGNWKPAMEYKDAIESLDVGERRSLNQWKKVAPNIVKAKFWKSRD